MSFTDKKFEITVFALIAVMVGGISYLFSSPSQVRNQETDLVYEMPRPKHFVGSGFDLDGREIDRNYINPFDKKKAAANAQAQNKPAPPPVAAAAKKAAAQKKKTADKKPKVDVNVVNNSPEGSSLSETSDMTGSRQSTAQNQQTTTTAKTDDVKKTDDKTSPDQWRAMISAQPTAENVAKLIQAYIKGDVDQNTYAVIVSDLLVSTKPEVQTLGLYAANYSYSVPMFSLVAQQMDTLSADNRSQAQGYLMSYTTGNRLNVLNAALRSSDSEIVVTAAEIVLKGYSQAKNGSTGGGRPGRGDSGPSILTSYSQFIPVFQTLAQSDNATIKQLASSALGQIQTTVASLSF
ncbi:hypothetical protein D3C87_176160 [compost metagenome]